MNGFRLGMYSTIEDGVRSTLGVQRRRPGQLEHPTTGIVVSKMLAGGIGGAVGGFLGSPFYLVRVRSV